MNPTDSLLNVGLKKLCLTTIGSFKEGVLETCDEVCGYKKCRKCNVYTWWWNSGAKDGIQKKKEAYREIMNNITERTQDEYRRLKTAAMNGIAKAIRKNNRFGRIPNNVFRLIRKNEDGKHRCCWRKVCARK